MKGESTLKIINGIKKVLDKFGEYWAYLIVVIVALPTLEAVVFRYLLHRPTIWSQEMTTILFGIFFMIGGAYCEKRNSHVAMDVFYSNFKGYVKAIVDTIIMICCLIVMGTLFYYGGKSFIKVFTTMERSDSLWAPLLWPSRICIPLGSGLLILRAFISYIEKLGVALSQIREKKALKGGQI
ncbi:MAG: TRAP transporter small permease subunit [Oscillospiraceae bacterium]